MATQSVTTHLREELREIFAEEVARLRAEDLLERASQLERMPPDRRVEELFDVLTDAYNKIDAALPTIRLGAEALGNTDEARSMWMVSYLLEGLKEKLGSPEGAP